LRTGDDLELVAAARAVAGRGGMALRVRSPEVLYDADEPWVRAVAAMGWDAVYARHVAALPWADTVFLEYPLQGLGSLTRALFGAAGVVCAPELSLDDIARLAAAATAAASATAAAATAPVVEVLAFGREQVLVSRDTLGLAEGLAAAPGGGPQAALSLTLTDARGYVFPVQAAAGETRIFNSRVTNLCGHLAELVVAGVRGVIIAQADLNGDERRAFAGDGLDGLAAFDDRERFTTGHLYRGVA
jgi:hypothetical protein